MTTWFFLISKDSSGPLNPVVCATCPNKFAEMVKRHISPKKLDSYEILVTTKVDKRVFGL